MSSTISIQATNKAEIYKELLPQIEALISYELDIIANLGNVAAVLNSTFDWLWIGFYRKEGNELILGPFQGPLACTRIPIGKGVCGVSAASKETILVDNVHEFEGHIACSSESNSEIVLPIFKGNEVVWILDIDSRKFSDFDDKDKEGLEAICKAIEAIL